jgi:hypothetical protein
MIKLIVFICGAVVMSFEILGSRVLAPNFGSSVFVWGSLISVFLSGLSAGYYFGGKAADRKPSEKKLAIIIIIPSVLFIAFPVYGTLFSDWIFENDLGMRLSPLAASVVLFFLPAVFLGAVSPYTVKMLMSGMHNSGRTVGTLYALSTLGSIFGTLITSFYLISLAGVKTLIMFQGVLLMAMAVPLLFMKLPHRSVE